MNTGNDACAQAAPPENCAFDEDKPFGDDSPPAKASASIVVPNFGRWRAQWLEQVNADGETTDAAFRVAFAISKFLNKVNRSTIVGNITLAEKANVTHRTVRNAL